MEGDRVAFVAQKGLPGGHGFKDAALAFFAEVVVDAAMTGDEAHNAFGQVGVEVVADDAPAHFRRDRAEEAVEEGGEIVLGAAVADRAQDRSGGHIEGGDQGLCAVSPVFEFVSFHLARYAWAGRGTPSQATWMPVISSIDTVRTVRASSSARP